MLARLVLASALALAACASPSWDYVPVVRGDAEGLTDAPELATPAHLDRAAHVLSYYGMPSERVDGGLRVQGEPPTREWLWNVTTKAEDPAWLRAHPPAGE